MTDDTYTYVAHADVDKWRNAAIAAAKQGTLAAIDCSIAKWKRNKDIGANAGNWHTGAETCALCQLYFAGGCQGCPLDDIGECCKECDSAYDRAAASLYWNGDGDANIMLEALHKAREHFLKYQKDKP